MISMPDSHCSTATCGLRNSGLSASDTSLPGKTGDAATGCDGWATRPGRARQAVNISKPRCWPGEKERSLSGSGWVPFEPVGVSQGLRSHLSFHPVSLVLLAVRIGRVVVWTVLWVRVLGQYRH